jgi:hypothetical protein
MTDLLGDYQVEIKKDKIKTEILEQCKKVPNFKSKKNDIQFLCHIMCLLETLIKKKHCIDKMSLLCEICVELFGALPQNEKEILIKNAQCVFDKKLVKKLNSISKVKNKIKSYFRK